MLPWLLDSCWLLAVPLFALSNAGHYQLHTGMNGMISYLAPDEPTASFTNLEGPMGHRLPGVLQEAFIYKSTII